jgi:hypothetical protein
VNHQTELLIHLHLSDADALQIFQHPEKEKNVGLVKLSHLQVAADSTELLFPIITEKNMFGPNNTPQTGMRE